MNKIVITALSLACGIALRAETGELINENGTPYLKGPDGSKSEILVGKKLAAQLTKFAANNYDSGKYDLARNYSQSSLETMMIGKEFDDKLIYENLRMLLGVESKLGDNYKVSSKYLTHELMSKLYSSLAGNYLKAKDYKQAKVGFSKAISYNPKNATAHGYLAVVLDMLQDYPAAVESYLAAIQLEPKNAESHFNLACSYSLQNNLEKSLQSLEKAFELGYSAKSALTDETLRNVRATPDFQRLLKKYPR